jgi:uncharacterized phage protein (TIGR01671 family)
MNRQLKFRIWDKTEKEFTNVSPSFVYNSQEKAFEFCGSLYQRENWVIQQFTGLKDSNGKEIYEGDILVEKHNGGEGEANIRQVYFAAGSFMINGDGPLYDYVHSLTPDILEDYTVQGNIFENA